VIDGVLPGQRAEEGKELLRAAGVINIGGDPLREFGRGTNPDPSQACGNFGRHRAAVLPDGTVTPCPLIRWMHAGNVSSTPLADILGTVTQLAATIADLSPCTPNDCFPDWKPCQPDRKRGPDGGIVQSRADVHPCNSQGLLDSYCNPLCVPGACKPRI
jgi:Iron-sulfur cluster-binding domain